MDQVAQASVIHFYDVGLHETLCGLRGFEHRSTKHARGVTCPSCLGLLRQRQLPGPASLPGDDGGSPASA